MYVWLRVCLIIHQHTDRVVHHVCTTSTTVHPACKVHGYMVISLIWPILWWPQLRLCERNVRNLISEGW